MFAIFAQNLLKGKLGYCQVPAGGSYGINQQSCTSRGYQWATQNPNFENVLQGLLTLFILSTQENWPTIMGAAMDANDADQVNSFVANLNT